METVIPIIHGFTFGFQASEHTLQHQEPNGKVLELASQLFCVNILTLSSDFEHPFVIGIRKLV